MNLERFFEVFLHINGDFGFKKYSTLIAHKDHIVNEIEEDPNKMGHWSGQMQCIIPVSGIPFCKSSRIFKVIIIDKCQE